MNSATPIVFCYLGEILPDYLNENLLRTRELFPERKTYLICSDGVRSLKSNPGVTILNNRENLYSSEVKNSLNNLTHEKGFRDGFWRLTIERLFALQNLLEVGNLNDFLYVESDVILMKDFPFDEIRNKSRKTPLIWSEHSEDHDAAALIYMRGKEQLTWFTKRLARELDFNPSHTDMSALISIRRKFPKRIGSFPSNIKSTMVREWSGVFDSAAIGMWLTGEDPRNNYGATLIRDSIQLENRGEKFEVDSMTGIEYFETDTIRVRYKTRAIPILCLHIHSKNCELFMSNSKYLQKLCADSTKSFALESFDVFLLVKLLIENLRRRTLLGYLKHMFRSFRTTCSKYRNGTS
jgi:hypothetical protein